MKTRPLSIYAVDNGFVAVCGCVTLVFPSAEKIITEFSRWANNPELVEKEYESRLRPNQPPCNMPTDCCQPMTTETPPQSMSQILARR